MTKKIFKSFLILTVMLMFSFGIRVQAEETDVPETGGDITEYVDSGSINISHWYSDWLYLYGHASYTIEYEDGNYGRFTGLPSVTDMVVYGDGYTHTYYLTQYFTMETEYRYKWSFGYNSHTYNVYLEVDTYGEVSVWYDPNYEQ